MSGEPIHDPEIDAHVAKHEPVALEGYMGFVRHPKWYKSLEAYKSRFERKEKTE